MANWIKIEIRRGKKAVESHKLTKAEAMQVRAQAVHLAAYLKDAYKICTCREVREES